MILQFQIERKNKIENSSRTAWGGIVAKYAKTIGFGKTIFAFLMLNTMSSAHNKIFGAKFLSFERAGIVC